MEKSNKILSFSVILLAIAAAFLGGYLIHSQSSIFQTSSITSSLNRFSGDKSNNQNGGEIKLKPKIFQLSSSRVYSAELIKSSKIRYVSNEGTIIEIDQDGLERTVVSEKNLDNFKNISWSPDGEYFIYFDDTRPYLYRVSDETSKPLDSRIKSVAFSPLGDKIAYHFFNKVSGEGNISISDPNGSNFEVLIKTRVPLLKISWPHKNKIAFQESVSADKKSSVYLLDVNQRTLTNLINNETGLDVSWSPSGSKVLYSSFNGNGLNLFVKEIESGKLTTISKKTFASKCAWGIREMDLYCSLPSIQIKDPIRPDYSNSTEYVIRYNIQTGEDEEIFRPASSDSILIKNPFMSSLGLSFYFINYVDGRLYYLSIK